jgi:hypothetical protein
MIAQNTKDMFQKEYDFKKGTLGSAVPAIGGAAMGGAVGGIAGALQRKLGKKQVKPIGPLPVAVPKLPRMPIPVPKNPTIPSYTVKPSKQFGALGSPSHNSRFSDIMARKISEKLQNY